MSSIIMKSLTFITFVVPEKIATLKFFPRRTITQVGPTLIINMDLHFQVSQKPTPMRYGVQQPTPIPLQKSD